MGLLDELKKLTKPYDDDDYFEEDLEEPIRPQERWQQPNRSYASYADYANSPQQQQEDFGRGGYAVNPQQDPGYNPYAQPGYGAPQQGYAQQPYPQQNYGAPQGYQPNGAYGAYGQDMGYGAPAPAQRMLLVKPERFEEAADIADRFREKNTIILNLETTPKDVSRRLLDFLSGVTYALSGKIKRAAGNTYVITPAGMDFAGENTDGFENRGTYF